MLDRSIEIEVKLFEPAKRLMFAFDVQSKSGVLYRAQTVEFGTHNSGGHDKDVGSTDNLHSNSNGNGLTSLFTKESSSYKKRKASDSLCDKNEEGPTALKLATSNTKQPMSTPSVQRPLSCAVPPIQDIKPVIKPQNNSLEMNSLHQDFNYFPAQPSLQMKSNTQSQQPPPPTTHIHGPLEVDGVVRARGFMQFSDLRLKTNITEIVDALEIVTNLQVRLEKNFFFSMKSSSYP